MSWYRATQVVVWLAGLRLLRPTAFCSPRGRRTALKAVPDTVNCIVDEWREEAKQWDLGKIPDMVPAGLQYNPDLRSYYEGEGPGQFENRPIQVDDREAPTELRFQTREQASDFQLALEFFGRWDEEPRSTGMVLDLGCGDALMARRFVQSKHFQTVFAVDILWAPLAAARAAAEAENTFKDGLLMLRGDAQSLPFREKQLDFVWWGLGIHKVQDAEKALRNIKEVLKPGGRMIATTRTFLYPPFELRLMAKTAGLENISVECVGEGTSAERLLLRAAAPRA